VAIAGPDRDRAALRLPADAIAEAIGDVICAIVPDPDGPRRRAAIEHGIIDAGVVAGLGTTVAPNGAALSFARARAALGLAGEEPGLLIARELAGELLLASDPQLAAELAGDRLAPLTGLAAGSRTRLTETLRAWLEEQGRLTQVARRLGVHPQTARYRVARLRELFGATLDDPDERFWLELALRVVR
jgi:sugar diacid utilization regulator